MPMLPPAPGLFSTTTTHFTLSVSFIATAREKMSVPPPGGNGTIKRIALSAGYSWANVKVATNALSVAGNQRHDGINGLLRTAAVMPIGVASMGTRVAILKLGSHYVYLLRSAPRQMRSECDRPEVAGSRRSRRSASGRSDSLVQ